MSEDKKHIDISRYLGGKMTQAEAHAFEKRALEDPFLQDAIEGAEKIANDDFLSDVDNLKARLVKKPKETTFSFWRIAAVISLLIVGGFSVWFIFDEIEEPELANKSTTEAASEVTKNVARVAEPTKQEETVVIKEVEPEEPHISNKEADVSTSSMRASGGGDKDEMEEKVAEAKEVTALLSADAIDEGAIAAAPSIMGKKELDQADFSRASREITEDALPSSFAKRDEDTISITPEIAISSALQGRVAGVSVDSFQDDENIIETADAYDQETKKQNVSRSRRAKATARSVVQNESKLINGAVTEESGEGLPGVAVVIKGTTTGVTSDLKGFYEIVATQDDVLIFSSVGMTSQEISVGARSVLDVQMSSDSQALQEVVVTGYGTFSNTQEGYIGANPVISWEEFKTYLEEKLFYPEEAIGNGVEGRVVLQLTISRIGMITDIQVKKSLGYGCDEEAIRLIEDGPKWKPATRDGLNVETKIRVKVNFELEK